MAKVFKVIYNYYNTKGEFKGEREYLAKGKDDLNRVMQIIESDPDRYELVNVKEQIVNA